MTLRRPRWAGLKIAYNELLTLVPGTVLSEISILFSNAKLNLFSSFSG